MKTRLIFMGDSLMQYNDSLTYPQTGWPQGLTNYLTDDVEIINLAKNGRSTKSYIDEGLFDELIKYVIKGSYTVIGFSHNDEKINDKTRYTLPNTTFKDNLLFFINEIRKRGGEVILSSPVTRRKLNNGIIEDTDHLPYKKAIEDVSIKENVFYVDLYTLSKDFFNEIGYDNSKEYYMNFPKDIYKNYKDGKEDNTHLRVKGANKISELFINEIKKRNHPLSLFIK